MHGHRSCHRLFGLEIHRNSPQVITFLYIGGASDSAALLTCQKTDAGGELGLDMHESA